MSHLKPGFTYRNPNLLLGIVLLFVVSFISCLIVYYFFEGCLRDTGAEARQSAEFGSALIFLFTIQLAVNAYLVMGYLNERIVLNDTAIRWYSWTGALKFEAPLAAIQEMRWVRPAGKSNIYIVKTDRGRIRLSDNLVQFAVFERHIASIIAKNNREAAEREYARQLEE